VYVVAVGGLLFLLFFLVVFLSLFFPLCQTLGVESSKLPTALNGFRGMMKGEGKGVAQQRPPPAPVDHSANSGLDRN
jgi:hypothetical protein